MTLDSFFCHLSIHTINIPNKEKTKKIYPFVSVYEKAHHEW